MRDNSMRPSLEQEERKMNNEEIADKLDGMRCNDVTVRNICGKVA